LHAWSSVKGNSETMERLSTFINIYGFSRNMTFSFLSAAVVLSAPLGFGGTAPSPRVATMCLLLASGMFYRYLKFYRQYAYEVLLTYMGQAANKTFARA
jgi:hypothetical protein